MGIAAEKIINQSNDGTFNIVVHYRYYNDDKYFVVVKNGGIATMDSVGQPSYRLITNIDGKDHVIECDSLGDAFRQINAHKHLQQLPDQTQAKIKPILKSLLGNYMFLTTHTTDQILDNIAKATDEISSNLDQNQYKTINDLLKVVRDNNKDVSDKIKYDASIRAIDKLGNLVYKLTKNIPQANKINNQIIMYNNLIARY